MNRYALRLAGVVVVAVSLVACPKVLTLKPLEAEAVPPMAPGNGYTYGRVWLIADNQQREILGEPSFYSAKLSQKSHVAIRSLQQDLYSKFVVQGIVDDIREAQSSGMKGPILHLGDALDYGCRSEFEMLQLMPWMKDSQDLFIAPGNHDVLFQGNASYLGVIGWSLLMMKKVVDWDVEPYLEGHHNAVCTPLIQSRKHVPDDVKKIFDDNRARYEKNVVPREFPDAREWPQNFACDYMRYRSAAAFAAADEIRNYCNDARYYSYFKNIKDAHGNRAEQQLLDGPTRFSHQMSFTSLSGSFYKWNKGHLVQRLIVPLSEQFAGDPKDAPAIGVIMLDTSDWESRPSWAPWQIHANAELGNVGDWQQKQVQLWIDEWTKHGNIKGIILAGHYPLRALENDTADWLAKLQARSSKVLPVYLSGHTHEGYTDVGTLKTPSPASPQPIREINVGSMVDAPIHYRDVILGWNETTRRVSVSSRVHHPDDAWQCRSGRRLALWADAKAKATAFNDSAFYNAKKQWCLRLRSAHEMLSAADGPAGQFTPKTTEQCLISDLSNTNTDTDNFLVDYREAEKRMITWVGNDRERARDLGCQSIAGAEVFNWHSGLPLGEVVSFSLPVAP